MSRWRKMLWPIYGEENKKFIPMLLMLALSLFNYTSLRITKDALIVTAPGSGAPVLNFLKGYVVMPMSLLFVIFYGKMRTVVCKKNLFYVTLIPFLAFFTIFALFLYPFSDLIHISPERLTAISEAYPRLRYIAPMFGYWAYSLFYVFSELWGSVSITLLFWQFANLTTKKDEVKRFYPLFGAYSNIGLILAGLIQMTEIRTEVTALMVVGSAFAIGVVYWWINKYAFIEEEIVVKESKSKVKLSLGDSFKVIMKSKYLGYITILVLAYGMTSNLVEITWKDKVKELYPAKDVYQSFMGKFFVATGCFTMFIGLCLKNTVQKFGWLISAMITPIVLLITSLLFYIFALYSNWILPAHLAMGTMPLVFAVAIGAIQNIASKASKYSLFDPTTQMSYIPLDDNLRITGKAAVDVLGGRLGKSMGGHIQNFALLLTGGSQMTIAPFLMLSVVIIIMLWISSTKKLAVEYAAKLKERDLQDMAAEKVSKKSGKEA